MSSRHEDDSIPPVLWAVPLAEIQGDDEEDTSLLKAMAESDGYQWIWVFEGDVPSAYMEVFGRYTNPHSALTRYIDGLQAWVEAAERGQSLPDLMPIEVPSTPKYVGMLRSRIATLRETILPNIRSD